MSDLHMFTSLSPQDQEAHMAAMMGHILKADEAERQFKLRELLEAIHALPEPARTDAIRARMLVVSTFTNQEIETIIRSRFIALQGAKELNQSDMETTMRVVGAFPHEVQMKLSIVTQLIEKI